MDIFTINAEFYSVKKCMDCSVFLADAIPVIEITALIKYYAEAEPELYFKRAEQSLVDEVRTLEGYAKACAIVGPEAQFEGLYRRLADIVSMQAERSSFMSELERG